MVWNSIEAAISVIAGLAAGPVSLIGFGWDGIIEVISGAALLWHLHHDTNPARREEVKRITLKIVGWCFVSRALYVIYESGADLIRYKARDRSVSGIILAVISFVVVPILARGKRRVSAGIRSVFERFAALGSARPIRFRASGMTSYPVRHISCHKCFFHSSSICNRSGFLMET